MSNVLSLEDHRMRQAEAIMKVADKAMAKVNTAFSQSMLRQATALVRAHFPDVKLREAWTYRFTGDQWEFHGPDKFYWNGNAGGAYDARYKGWMAWLKSKGIDLDAA